jgi:hypothetical protein
VLHLHLYRYEVYSASSTTPHARMNLSPIDSRLRNKVTEVVNLVTSCMAFSGNGNAKLLNCVTFVQRGMQIVPSSKQRGEILFCGVSGDEEEASKQALVD